MPRSKPNYGPAEVELLRLCWLVTDGICSKRLAPFLPELLDRLRRRQAFAAVPNRGLGACRTHESGHRRSCTEAVARADQGAAWHQHHESRHAAETTDRDWHVCRLDGRAARLL